MNLCFIQANWHQSVVAEIRSEFMSEIHRINPKATVTLVEVSGIFEIPLQAKLNAKTGKYSAIVVSGVITTGGVYRSEYIAHAVIRALLDVQLEQEIPIISAILMPLDDSDADVEAYCLKHAATKGKETAHACIQIVDLMEKLRTAL